MTRRERLNYVMRALADLGEPVTTSTVCSRMLRGCWDVNIEVFPYPRIEIGHSAGSHGGIIRNDLGGLAVAGYATSRKKGARRIFELTPLGRAVFEEWYAENYGEAYDRARSYPQPDRSHP